MKDLSLKMKIILVIAGVIVVGTIGLYIYSTTKSDYNIDEEIENSEELTGAEDTEGNTVSEKIMVHITGEVKEQGVVVLENGARIVDAIEAAGGETEEADLSKLNLAYILNDGEKIYVPSKNDEEENVEYVTTSNGETETASKKININTAGAQELTELPGVGESTANKIIAYRKENGKFETIEDLKNVPGIGNSKFDNLKEMITVR